MIKHDFGEEVRLKELPKLGFLSNILKVKPSSRRDMSWRRHDMGYEPRQRRDVQVLHRDVG